MGGNFFKKVEDRPTPPEVYNWKIYFVAAVASAGAATIGYDSAFIGGTMALPSFKKELGFDEMSISHVNLVSANIVSCYQAGAFLFLRLSCWPLPRSTYRSHDLFSTL